MDISNSLIYAVCEGRLERARDIIHSYGLSYSEAWSEGYILLCVALKNKHAAVAKLLLTSGSKVNSKNTIPSDTPLHLAVINCDIEIVEMIIVNGGDINAKNQYGRTPLHTAVQNNNLEVIELLLSHRADVNAKHSDGTTALHIATEKGNKEVVKMLLNKGANIDSQDKYGRTPLHLASKRTHYEVVVTLLEYDADVNITSYKDCTPLDVALDVYEKCSFEYDIYEDSLPDSFGNIIIALEDHILKMRAADLYVNEKNLLETQRNWLCSEMKDKCEEEIAYMKREKISNLDITFYDILTKGTDTIVSYMRNENIAQVLKSVDYKSKFPIYGKMIERSFRKGFERKELLEQANNIFP